MSSFSTTERLAAKLKKPKEVYSYSITDGKVTMDQSQLKYYYLPEETILKAPIDLTKGIERIGHSPTSTILIWTHCSSR